MFISSSNSSRFLVIASFLMTAAACGSAQTKSFLHDEATPSKAKTFEPADRGGRADQLMLNEYAACYSIEKFTGIDGVEDTWGPKDGATTMCTETPLEVPYDSQKILNWGWQYTDKDGAFAGVAGGVVSKDSDCEACVSVFHAWFMHVYKIRPTEKGLELAFFDLTDRKTGQRLDQPLLTKTVELKKISALARFQKGAVYVAEDQNAKPQTLRFDSQTAATVDQTVGEYSLNTTSATILTSYLDQATYTLVIEQGVIKSLINKDSGQRYNMK